MRPEIHYMKIALDEADKAQQQGEVPVGAVVVAGSRVLSRNHNQTVNRNDPTAHAEVLALRDACLKKRSPRIPGCDLYVTLEPCAMCLGAAVQARIRRLVYGAADPKAGAVVSIMRFPFVKTNHSIDVKGGILEDRCGKILKDFFRNKR